MGIKIESQPCPVVSNASNHKAPFREQTERRERKKKVTAALVAWVAVKLSGTSLGGPPERLVSGGVVNRCIGRGMAA